MSDTVKRPRLFWVHPNNAHEVRHTSDVPVGCVLVVDAMAFDASEAARKKADAVADAADRHALACRNEVDALKADLDALAASLERVKQIADDRIEAIIELYGKNDALAATVERVKALRPRGSSPLGLTILVADLDRAILASVEEE